jgi:hypothetical protein
VLFYWFGRPIYHYLSKYKLLHESQSGFRCKHLCHTALTNLTDRRLKYMDDGNLIGTVFLDLKKAFDMVDHKICVKSFSITRYLQILWNGLNYTYHYAFKVASISNIFLPLMLKVVSSTYISISDVKFSSGRSFINIIKSRGPKWTLVVLHILQVRG